jgi:hypothetical protein
MVVVALAVGIGIGVVATRALTRSHGTTSPHAAAINMDRGTGVSCSPPVPPGPGHPARLLSQVFSVVSSQGIHYTLGWQLVPFLGPRRGYRLGRSGNLLALEPATGGLPLGYGMGTITLGTTFDQGTIDATVELKHGGAIPVSGTWHCRTG